MSYTIFIAQFFVQDSMSKKNYSLFLVIIMAIVAIGVVYVYYQQKARAIDEEIRRSRSG